MKLIKKIVMLLLVAICTLFCACEEKEVPLSKNQPYVFEKSVCSVYEGVDMQKLSSFIPVMMPYGQKTPKTVAEFENMVLENIDDFYIIVREEDIRREVYFLNPIQSIEITDTVFKFVGEESMELPYVQDGNTYTVTAGEMSMVFTYENNRLSYSIEAPEYFSVTHYFKLA